ncbi:MAG: hypothetical protein Q4G60_09570, partial [bacterium]|nr:hypothetical protein [bacterium]
MKRLMRIKTSKMIAELLIIAIVLTMSGCSLLDAGRVIQALTDAETGKQEDQVMAVDGYDILVMPGSDWEQRTDEDIPYDLQCIYKNNEAYASFFYYFYIDMSDGTSAEDVFEMQTDDIMGKRDHVKVVEDVSERENNGKTIRSILFEGEKDGYKNYYYANLVEFGEAADQFAWVMFTSMPSDMEKNRAAFDA